MPTQWLLTGGAVLGSLALLACGSDPTTSTSKTCGASGAAANITATSSLSFAPAAATINAGQSVCWQNGSQFAHTVTSDEVGAFNNGLAIGDTFIHTFANKGTFTYHCSIHAVMTGTITVQ